MSEPLSLAALGLAGLGAVGKGVSAFNERSGLLSDEQEARLRELERLQAINLLGGDYSQALGKQLTPVQGAMREAREQMAKDISSQDIQSGSYFRGQQALAEAAGKERIAAEQNAREAIRQEEERRQKELDELRERERLESQKWAAGFGALAAELGGAAPSLMKYSLALKEQAPLIKAAGGKMNEKESSKGVKAFKKYQNGTGMTPPVLPTEFSSWEDWDKRPSWLEKKYKMSIDEIFPDIKD